MTYLLTNSSYEFLHSIFNHCPLICRWRTFHTVSCLQLRHAHTGSTLKEATNRCKNGPEEQSRAIWEENCAFVIGCFKTCPKVNIVHNNLYRSPPPHHPTRDSHGQYCVIYIYIDTQLVSYCVTSCSAKRLGDRQLNIESKSTNTVRRPRFLVWLCGCLAGVLRFTNP